MKVAIASVPFWESLGFNTTEWRKSLDGSLAMCHLEYAEMFATNIETNTAVTIYDRIDPDFQTLINSPAWNAAGTNGTPDTYGLLAELASFETSINNSFATFKNGELSVASLELFKKLDTDIDDSERIQRALDYCAANDIPLVLRGGVYYVYSLDIPVGVKIYGNGAIWKKPELDAAPYNMTVDQMKWARQASISYTGDIDSPVTVIDGITFDGNCWSMWDTPSYDQEQASLLFAQASSTTAGRLRLRVTNCHFQDNVSDGVHIWTNVIFQASNCSSKDCFRGGLTLTGGNTDATIDGWVSSTEISEMRDGIDIEIDASGYDGSYKINVSLANMILDDDFDIAVPSESVVTATNITMKGGSWYLYCKGRLYISNSYLRKLASDNWNALIAGSGELVFTNCTLDGGDTLAGVAMPLQVVYETGIATTDSAFRFNSCRFVNCRHGVGGALLKTNLYFNDCDFDDNCETAIGFNTGNPPFQPLAIHVNNTRFNNFGYAVRVPSSGTYMQVTQLYLSGNKILNPSNLGLYVRHAVTYFRESAGMRWSITKESGGLPMYYDLEAGITANTPQDPQIGQRYFDTTLEKWMTCTELGVKEVITLTVTTGATISGNIRVVLNGNNIDTAVTAGMTAIQVADTLRAKFHTQFETGGDVGTDVVTFTKRFQGPSSPTTFSDIGATGVSANPVLTTAGVSNVWSDGSTTASQRIIDMELFVKGVSENDDSARMQRAINYASTNNVPLELNGGEFLVHSLSIPAGTIIKGNGAVWKKPNLSVAPYNMTEATMKWIRLASVPYSNAQDSAETVIEGIDFQGDAWSMWSVASSAQDQAALLYCGSGTSLAGRLRVKIRDCHFANNVAAGMQTFANVIFEVENCSSVDCWRGGLYVSGGNTDGVISNWHSESTRDDMPDGINVLVESGGYEGAYTVKLSMNNILIDSSLKLTASSLSVIQASNIVMNKGTWYLYATGKIILNSCNLKKDYTVDTSKATIANAGEIIFNNCELDGGNTTSGISVPMATYQASSYRTGSFRFNGCRFVNCRYGIGSALLDALVFLDNCDFPVVCETAIGYDTGNPSFQPIELHVSNCRFYNYGYAVRANAVATYMPLTKLYLSGNKVLNPANLGLYLQSPFVYMQDDEYVRWPITISGSGAPLYYGLYAGTTARRPQDPKVGQQYFDTDLAKPILVKTLGVKEVLTLTITAGATASGNISLSLGGSNTDVALVAGDTAIQVADKIRAKFYRLYEVGGTLGTDTITFTKRFQGPSSASSYNPWSTGTTANLVQTTVGVANTWMDATGTSL